MNGEAIIRWWNHFTSLNYQYELAGKNCSWVVVEALRAGGSDKFFPWYRIGVKRNIPFKNVIFPMLILVMRYYIMQGYGFSLPISALKFLKNYIDALDTSIEPKKPLKLVAVAAVDEFSSFWSPKDTFAYCSLLKENADRTRQGMELLRPPS